MLGLGAAPVATSGGGAHDAVLRPLHRDQHSAHRACSAPAAPTAPGACRRMAGEGAEKRKAEDGGAEEAAKRPRVDGSNGGAPGAAPAAKKIGIDLEKLKKAKEALQKQKELAEKLKKAGITVRGGCGWGATAVAAAAVGCAEPLLLAMLHLTTAPPFP